MSLAMLSTRRPPGRPSMRPNSRSSMDPEKVLRNLFWLWLSGKPSPVPPLTTAEIARLEAVSKSTVRSGIAAVADLIESRNE